MADVRAIKRNIGRRGTVLVLVGLGWIGVGIDVWFNPTPRFTTPGQPPGGYLHFMDQGWPAIVWAVCGIVTASVGLVRGSKVMNEREVIGFNTALTPPLLWLFTYAWSIISFVVTGGAAGRASSFVAVIVYSIVAAFILVIAGWPEPQKPEEFTVPVFRDDEKDE